MEEQRQIIQKYKKCGRQQNYKNVNVIQRERNKNTRTVKRMLEEPFGDVREFFAWDINYFDKVVYNIRMKLEIRRRINSGNRCYFRDVIGYSWYQCFERTFCSSFVL
jgi:hypothetical protein